MQQGLTRKTLIGWLASCLVIGGLFVGLSYWWISLNPFQVDGASEHARYVWGASYQLLALFGGLFGLLASGVWGSYKSIIGKAVLVFSIGLLLQAFGQSVYSFYNLYLQVETPYPSIGDIGYFGSVLVYIYGTWLLFKASGSFMAMRRIPGFSIGIILPVAMLLFSYFQFLQGYEFDWSQPLRIFLDFGYPLGQALYVSLAILVVLLSYKKLGGIMRFPIFLILLALVSQYFSDFNFLYQASRGTWYVGGYGDALYMVSYALMAAGLIQFRATYSKAMGL